MGVHRILLDLASLKPRLRLKFLMDFDDSFFVLRIRTIARSVAIFYLSSCTLNISIYQITKNCINFFRDLLTSTRILSILLIIFPFSVFMEKYI